MSTAAMSRLNGQDPAIRSERSINMNLSIIIMCVGVVVAIAVVLEDLFEDGTPRH